VHFSDGRKLNLAELAGPLAAPGFPGLTLLWGTTGPLVKQKSQASNLLGSFNFLPAVVTQQVLIFEIHGIINNLPEIVKRKSFLIEARALAANIKSPFRKEITTFA
jgi:hypothetical protein